MKLKKIALIGGAMVAALSGMTVAACSSSSTPVVPSVDGSIPGTDGGPGPGPGTDSGPGPGTDSGPGPGTDSGPGPGTDAAACKIPSIHANPAGSIFCGYEPDGGPSFNCDSDSGTQQCCLGGSLAGGGFAPEQCAAFGTACTNGTKAVAIECGQISDCTANGAVGAACCLQGVTAPPAVVSGCPATDLQQKGGTAIACEMADGGASDGGRAPACAPTETQICSADTDCPDGKTCVAMHWKLYNLGFCQ